MAVAFLQLVFIVLNMLTVSVKSFHTTDHTKGVPLEKGITSICGMCLCKANKFECESEDTLVGVPHISTPGYRKNNIQIM